MTSPRATPLIIADRGASADAPEHTIAAFELALDQGADGIALDVHLTRDGQPVVIHDFTAAGSEERDEFVDFYGWLRRAVEDLIEFD